MLYAFEYIFNIYRDPFILFLSCSYITIFPRSFFLICGYGIFPSLRRAMSYSWAMFAYDLYIYLPFSFVSTLWRYFFVPFPFVSTLYPVLSPSISMLDLILSPPVSMLDLISFWFDLTLTTFSKNLGPPTQRIRPADSERLVQVCLFMRSKCSLPYLVKFGMFELYK